jgi:L-fucose isomerase-like protein
MGTGAQGERVILFGGRSRRYSSEWGITEEIEELGRKTEMEFVEVPETELVGRYERVVSGDDKAAKSLAEDLARELILGQNAPKKSGMAPAPPLEQIFAATALFTAMDAIRDTLDGAAVSIGCSKWIHDETLPTPCVALMLFQDYGVPAACQVDADAMTLMVLVRRVTGKVSFMGGGKKTQGVFGVSHCVLSRRMIGPELQPYRISNYHGRKESPTVWTRIPAGHRVTVSRLTANAERLDLATGTVVACPNSNNHCRNTIAIEGPDRNKLLKSVRGVQNHFLVTDGDISKELTKEAARLHIEINRL